MRYPVRADHFEAARLAAEAVEGGAHRADDQVPLVTGEGFGALTCDVDGEPGVGDPDDHVVVEAEGESEGVEAGAQVGTGRGDPDPDGGGTERRTGHGLDPPGELGAVARWGHPRTESGRASLRGDGGGGRWRAARPGAGGGGSGRGLHDRAPARAGGHSRCRGPGDGSGPGHVPHGRTQSIEEKFQSGTPHRRSVRCVAGSGRIARRIDRGNRREIDTKVSSADAGGPTPERVGPPASSSHHRVGGAA